jgi:phenylalanine-4-hydroxylase
MAEECGPLFRGFQGVSLRQRKRAMASQVEEFVKDSGALLRGDYSHARADFSVDQDPGAYTPAEQDLWRRLYQRQMKLLPGYGYEGHLDHLSDLRASEAIPDFQRVSDRMQAATGWRIVAVPGLLPDLAFFGHLAARRFPVTVWLRKPEEFDYIAEPDVFHDFFGHVPLLFDPTYASHLESYGKGGLKAARLDALKMLARIYWYTVEFGLIRSPRGLRVFGAGILSSGGEIRHAIDSPEPHRIAFDVERVLRTEYRIDSYQDTYFVIDSFEQLCADTAPDFTPIYARLRNLPSIAPDAILDTDRLVGRSA